MVIFGALSTAVVCLNSVVHLAALHVATDASYRGAFGGQGPDAADLDEFWQSRYREACRPLYALAPPASIAALRAVAWAVEAGYAPSVEAVEAVLDGGEVFAEDQFKLLAALGLPGLTGAAPEPG